jgi:hypothetical protein
MLTHHPKEVRSILRAEKGSAHIASESEINGFGKRGSGIFSESGYITGAELEACFRCI